MSAAVRFLTLAVVGWVGVRAATIGAVPGSEMFSLARGEARTIDGAVVQVPPLEPAVPFATGGMTYAPQLVPSGAPQAFTQPIYMPYSLRIPVPYPGRIASYSVPAPNQYAALQPDNWPRFEDWPSYRFVPSSLGPQAAAASAARVTGMAPIPPKFDRLQLTAWALLRGRQGVTAVPDALASGGTLGGSQAGARLTYRFVPEIAASLRTTSAVGTSQSEIAGGVRVTPLRSLPLAFTVERRHALGNYGGRSAFAMFIEGGVYQRPIWGFDLDAYAQAGVVGVRDRALFADGGFTFSRPVYRHLSAGFGAWGGIQPGVHRVDFGPRVSYRVRPNVRVHADWRQRIAGNAAPGSGPALTLAADF